MEETRETRRKRLKGHEDEEARAPVSEAAVDHSSKLADDGAEYLAGICRINNEGTLKTTLCRAAGDHAFAELAKMKRSSLTPWKVTLGTQDLSKQIRDHAASRALTKTKSPEVVMKLHYAYLIQKIAEVILAMLGPLLGPQEISQNIKFDDFMDSAQER